MQNTRSKLNINSYISNHLGVSTVPNRVFTHLIECLADKCLQTERFLKNIMVLDGNYNISKFPKIYEKQMYSKLGHWNTTTYVINFSPRSFCLKLAY